MKTFSDLIDYVQKMIDYAIHNDCYFLYCDTCVHRSHCFIDSYIQSLDYLYRGEYYG